MSVCLYWLIVDLVWLADSDLVWLADSDFSLESQALPHEIKVSELFTAKEYVL